MLPILKSRLDLGYFLNDLGLIGTGVEVGVFRGSNARDLLNCWCGKKLILVDPWSHLDDYVDSWNLSNSEMEQNYHTTLETLAGFEARIQILRMRSEEAAPLVPNSSCDLVYIDANHSYEAVKRDLHLWFPKLRAGGLMSGHDYFDALADEHHEPIRQDNVLVPSNLLTSYGVRTAVDEFASALGATVSITAEHEPTWYFIKALSS